MQKSMVLNKKWLKHSILFEMRKGCHQRDPSGLEKHQTFEFAIFSRFFKVTNEPLKDVNSSQRLDDI